MVWHDPNGRGVVAGLRARRVGSAEDPWPVVVVSHAASVLLLLGVWGAVSALVGPSVLPGPWRSISAVRYSAQDGYLWSDMAVTLHRMVEAFALALVVSLVAGTLLARSRWVERLFGLWVTIGASLPALVVIVAVYLAVGISDRGAVVATAVIITPSMTAGVWDGLRTIDVRLGEMARAFGIGRWTQLRRVAVPQTYPALFTTARAGWALAWRIVIFVELLGRSTGVGYRIQYWYDLADMPRAIAAAIPFVVLMFLIDVLVLRSLERHVMRWRAVESR